MSALNRDGDISKVLDFEGRMTRVEVTNEHIVEALNEIKKEMREGFSCLNNRIDNIVEKIDNTNLRIDKLYDHVISKHKWIIASIFSAGALIIGILHWIGK